MRRWWRGATAVSGPGGSLPRARRFSSVAGYPSPPTTTRSTGTRSPTTKNNQGGTLSVLLNTKPVSEYF